MSLEPSSATVDAGETTTYDVVVESADGGVGAYDFTVSVDDPSVASIADVAVQGNPSAQTTDVTIADDGSSADVVAALADTDDTGSVTIATITVEGDAAGTSDIGLSVDAVGTEAGESYTVTDTTGASITVEDDATEPEPEPEPADFQVSNLNAPDNATQGDAIDVSADVTNDGDEEATQTVQFRLDLDGDGTLDADETLTSQDVTLEGGETQTVTFSDLDTSDLEPGTYAHGVFTENDSATATISIEEAADPDPEPAPETAVSLEPSSETVNAGDTTTYDVIVESADGGVGAYDFSVSVDDSSVASIADVAVQGNPSAQTTDVTIADDGSSVDVVAALADTDETGSVTIATVTVSGDAVGTSDIGLSVDALGTEAGESYTVTETTGASITVVAAQEPEPEPEPADFQVSNLNAPDSATQGDAIDVSADVTNDGDEEATQPVQFRLDLDGDGTLDADEALTSQDVTLEGGETQTVAFNGLDTSGLEPGTYAHGVFTEDDSATATISIEETAEPTPALETAVTLEPSSATVDVGETTTYDVVVESADGGVGAYDFTVSIDDPSVASITDVAVQGNPSAQTTDVTIAADGSSADVVAALADTDDTGSVTIATITAEGDAAGTSDVGLSVDALGTEAGESYTVTDTTGASITVEDDATEPEPEPADFQVSNLNAPDSATQGDAIDVSADVTNDGDEEATQTVQFRLDLDGDGTLDADETLTSQDVTLEGGETQTVAFSGLDTSGLEPGTYAHGVFTDDDSATATITIEEADEPTDGAEFTLDEISQAKYGYDFAELSTETSGQVQAIYNRQPFPDGTTPADIRTREEIANDRYGQDFTELSRETTIEVQNDYDAQFGPLPSDPAYSRDEISQAKYGYDFAELSTETSGQVQAIYNRQPFPDGTTPADIRTREEIANDRHGQDFTELSRETTIEIQNDYDAQFDDSE